MLHTTLNLLKLRGVCGRKPGCGEGYDKLWTYLGKGWSKSAPIPLTTILDSNGLNDTLWCLGAVLPEEQAEAVGLAQLLVCDYAEHVLPLFERECPDDPRPRHAIAVARRYVAGLATAEELDAACDAIGAAGAAGAAAWAAWAARAAAWAAAWAARAAIEWVAEAAWAAAGAAWAARAAAWAADAAWAARAAGAAGAAGAAPAGGELERQWQMDRLRNLLA